MTTQPTPRVTSADVERIVRRDFPAPRVAEVRAMLGEYGAESWQNEPFRVRLAVLKLAAGNLERLREQIENAKQDYRDVLAPAEYPGYSRKVFGVDELPPGELQRIVDAVEAVSGLVRTLKRKDKSGQSLTS